MPLDPVKVALAMEGGLSAVCATCTKYWDARDKRLPEPTCLAVDGCGSPLAGDCFHEYDGPISNFSSLCFVCGEKPKYGLRSGLLVRVIGVCEKHVQLVHQLQAKGREHIPLKIHGAPPAPEKKKTLGELIAQVDDHITKHGADDI